VGTFAHRKLQKKRKTQVIDRSSLVSLHRPAFLALLAIFCFEKWQASHHCHQWA
jgi:hypothetical protein